MVRYNHRKGRKTLKTRKGETMKKYEIYTNYCGCYPSELEETFETMAEVETWIAEFESMATCEESYIVVYEGETIIE